MAIKVKQFPLDVRFELPSIFKWVAQDQNGSWWAFVSEPVIDKRNPVKWILPAGADQRSRRLIEDSVAVKDPKWQSKLFKI